MYVFAAIGTALLVVANLLLRGGAARLGSALVGLVLGARAFALKIDSDLRKHHHRDQTGPRGEAAGGVTGVVPLFLGFTAAGVALYASFRYGARLLGFEVDPYIAAFEAFFVLGLLGLEWGLVDQSES